MIGWLSGVLARKATEFLIVDVQGVGYRVHVPLSTFYSLGDEGDAVELRIHTHVRDDDISLFGFLEESEHRLFEQLITVAGIGPKLAVTILSGMEIEPLVRAIAEEDTERLSTIPGVGTKTADRLALELKDKAEELVSLAGVEGVEDEVRDDVVSALSNLGYRKRDAERALEQVEDPAERFEELLRQTLRVLAGT